MKRKVISLLLVMSMVFSSTMLTGCKKKPENEPTKTKEQIVIGSVTDIDANMMDGWTNGGTNSGIRTLMFGYEPITYTKKGQFVVDKQVTKDFKTTENADKTKTMTITLQDDLKWNNGEKITATDYIFSLMLHASPEFIALQAADTTTFANCFVGYEDWHNGKTKTFKGLNIIDEHTFSFTIKAEELPFHFDTAYASFAPYPIKTIAPDVTITNSDKGSTISDNFNIELLKKTISDTKTGYRYNPKVTCGAYNFDSFDTT
ncbi:MAG: ABC transporter substrate-binding protein, partial [Oscillospiraceae bacterium]